MTSTFGDKFYDVSAGDNASAGDDAAVVPSQVASAPSAQPDLTGAPVKYLEHLLTTRQSLSRNYLDVLPGAYNVLLADRVRRESSDVLDEKTIETNATSLMSHCATFAGIVKNIDLVCNTLDETIVHLLDQIPSSNEKAEVIRNNEDYFVHLLSIHIDKFDSYQLAADPETYLDAFVPSFIIDAPTDQLNWRTFLASYGSPFIRNFVIRALKGVSDWEAAKARIAITFRVDNIASGKLTVHTIKGVDGVQNILQRVAKGYQSIRLLTLRWISALCGNHQQQQFIEVLEDRDVLSIENFDFVGLYSELSGATAAAAHTATGSKVASAVVPTSTSTASAPAAELATVHAPVLTTAPVATPETAAPASAPGNEQPSGSKATPSIFGGGTAPAGKLSLPGTASSTAPPVSGSLFWPNPSKAPASGSSSTLQIFSVPVTSSVYASFKLATADTTKSSHVSAAPPNTTAASTSSEDSL